MVEADTLVAQTLNSVWCGDGSASGEVYAAGDSGVFLVRKGGTWSSESTPVTTQINGLWAAGDELYAVGSAGTVLQRKAGTWKQEAMGLTSELLSAVWGSTRGGQTTVYAVGNSGTILRRTAGTWGRCRPASPATPCRASGPEARRKFMPSAAMVWCCGAAGLPIAAPGRRWRRAWSPPLNYVTGYAPAPASKPTSMRWAATAPSCTRARAGPGPSKACC